MWANTGLTSMLPPEMEGGTFPLYGGNDAAAPSRPLERPAPASVALAVAPELPPRRPRDGAQNGGHTQSTIRSVTPEPRDARQFVSDAHTVSLSQPPGGSGPRSPQSSPRSPTTARTGAFTVAVDGLSTSRRQGVVFADEAENSVDDPSSMPSGKPPPFRPRTHTLDGALRQQLTPAGDSRQRVNSFSSGGPQSLRMNEDLAGPLLQPHRESLPIAHQASHHKTKATESQPPTSTKSKDKKSSSSRSRLVKRSSSQPTSPQPSPPPSVDSLPVPVPTSDANKILLLMKALCGRMRSDVEYQSERAGPWSRGICYIEQEKGSLMFDSGDTGPFHTPIIPDLRGCRVSPLDRSDQDDRCIEVISIQTATEILLRPLVAEDFDLWLAALLCWQQLRQPGAQISNGRGTTHNPKRPERVPSTSGLSNGAIIKVGKLMLWDKGVATTPRALVRRPSTRDLRLSQTGWKRISCILQDNGEFKLMGENDVTVLSVIELSQLSRCAIQQLDRSVLDEEFCIGIFPIYSSTSSRLSVLRPVYVALESRVLFEVWFVLLRAFTAPGIFELRHLDAGEAIEVTDHNIEPTTNHFRMEKTVTLRVTEAKLRPGALEGESGAFDRTTRLDQAEVVGNYLAEVILDGEVRARTTIKVGTKNPFWREDCEFVDLPSTVPFLSVLLKRVDGHVDGLDNRSEAFLGASRTGSLIEVPCGTVEIPLHQLEQGKDHEQWHPIFDDAQRSIGTMLIKVHHEELVVLCSKEYQPLSELLHRFSDGLTAQIAEAVHGGSRRLAEIFLNIFQVSGKATEWLMNLVEDEIDGIGNQAAINKPRFSRRLKSNESTESTSDREQTVRDMGKSLAGEANLLFRGNSLLTQALEFHMRRLGKEYLEDVLLDKINEINDANANCEVDPSKVTHAQDIHKNWAELMRFIMEIWERISQSANRVPQELRHILKYIRAVAEDRYGDFLRTVTYTSVSGFLFLRFICPAILNPKLFGLLRDHPRPHAQRTLTLIAKCLQALANLSTIGKKETWTQPMNHFLNTRRQALKDFIDSVCAIPMERTAVTVPASYSTPITILGRLAPLSREGFPSLPYLIDHARNFATLVKLWTDAHPPSTDAVGPRGSSTRVFGGDLLDFHSLCNAIQERADERRVFMEKLRLQRLAAATCEEEIVPRNKTTRGLAAAESDRLSELVDVFDRSSLHDATGPSPYGSSTAVWTDQEAATAGSGSTLRPPGSSGSDMDSPALSAAALRDAARLAAKELSNLRPYTSATSEWHMGASPASTIRGLKNGKHARKLLGGFMRKGKTGSPDVSAGSRTPLREDSQDDDESNRSRRDRREQSRERNDKSVGRGVEDSRAAEGDVVRDRKKGLGLSPESRAVDKGGSVKIRRQQTD